jgi:hypothetical protein
MFAATVGEDDVKLFKYSGMTIRGKKREKARSSKFTCRGTSIPNGITATWMTVESWESRCATSNRGV